MKIPVKLDKGAYMPEKAHESQGRIMLNESIY